MPQLYYDMLFCSTFVVVLLAMYRVKGRFSKTDGEAINRILTGLWFLTGFSLVQLMGHQHLLAGIPFLGEASGRQVVEAFGIVGGLIFLLIGIGALLPSLAIRRKERRQMTRRYFCLKMITQAIDHEKTLDNAYKRVMSCLTTYLGMTQCAAFSYRSRQDTLYLNGTTGFAEKLPSQLRRLPLSGTRLKAVLSGFRAARGSGQDNLPSEVGRPDMVIPVSRRGRLYGALLCWIDEKMAFDDDLIDFATTVGEMLGECAHTRVETTRREYYRTQQTAHKRVGDLCAAASSVKDIMADFYRIIGEITEVEFLSVAVLDRSGENMIGYTIGSSGRLLLEKGVSRRTRGGDVFRTFQEAKPMLKSVIDPAHDHAEEDGLFLSCGMRSKLAFPVKQGNKVLAVAVLGHARPGYFTGFHLHRLEDIVNLLGGVIQREQLSRTLEVKEDHMLRLQFLERELSSDAPLQTIFDNACDLLSRRMKCTMARISLVDREEKNLISQACRSIRDTGHELKESAEIPLSLLPWHRMTLDAQKLMLINQEDSESRMPPQESTSALIPNIRSAMLVPITLNNKVRGIISLGEARNWNRRSFAATDLIFAKDVAAKCSVALRTKKLQLDIQRFRDRTARSAGIEGDQWSAVKAQMSSPLTSIIGAVELMKRKSSADETTERYQDLILKSAERIKTLSEEYGDGVAVKEDTQPEMVSA